MKNILFAVLLSVGSMFAVTNQSVLITDGTNSFWLPIHPQAGEYLMFSSTGFTFAASGGGVSAAQLNTASNAVVTYADGVTNGSIARQAELTAASNAVYAAKQNSSANLDQWASIGTNWNWNALHTNALTAKAAHTDLVTASNVLNSALVDNDITTSNGVVSYANSVTNSSIVRQTESTSLSNAVIAHANGVTNASIVRQLEITAASNTLAAATIAATNAPQVTNWINFRQPSTPALTNLSGNPNVVTQIIAGAGATVTSNNAGVFTVSASGGGGGFITTNLARTVLGAGSGNTNYLIQIFTNSANDFYLGSSNVNLYTVIGGTLGAPIWFDVFVTNLSAISWGIRFQAGTNRWLFSSVTGLTNSPSVLTNNTRLHLRGRTDGSNIMCEWRCYRPAF